MAQLKQSEWHKQWEIFRDEELFLFQDWIYPVRLEDFQGKDVLECGCGGGQHTSFIAPYAKSITAVDLNTVDIAVKRNKDFKNIEFIEADIASMDLGKKFDIVFSIGVVHHTENPDKVVENLKRHVLPGGRLILWVYSQEGNFLVSNIVEPLRKVFLRHLNKRVLMFCSKVITLLLYPIVYSLYRFPLHWLPYYEYFENFRKLSLTRNCLNVFDKLNAPQVEFISKKRITDWFPMEDFKNVHISSYKGVSWRGSAAKI
ncbi:MAG: class I SAM-dependent methyltransferase [Candidatus Omnitrophica bacterium]|nr:class I SAM-dependent methyltransferase [Candidatus Omnitrophota bacterium]